MFKLTADDLTNINTVTTRFYQAFDNRQCTPNLANLTALFTDNAHIITIASNAFITETLNEFIAPRQQRFNQLHLVNFYEWEIDSQTKGTSAIATRCSQYRSVGLVDGQPVDITANKIFNYIKQRGDWKIAGLIWHKDS